MLGPGWSVGMASFEAIVRQAQLGLRQSWDCDSQGERLIKGTMPDRIE